MENSAINKQATQPPNDQPAQNEAWVLPPSFKIRLTMLSDWHVGTGAGRPGSVDKLIARDADGFPFVPAKTLNGIWRDALERLTLGLDGGKAGAWSTWVETIFGAQPNQIDAKELSARLENDERTYTFSPLSARPARLSEGLRVKIAQAVNALPATEQERQRQKLLAALTFIKPGVAIDEESGAAVTDFLRFEEMGRAGTVLEAYCALTAPDATISALLLLSAKLVERLGGKRRRGAGLCELKIEERDESHIAQAIEHIRQVERAQNSDGAQAEKSEERNDGDRVSETRSIIREAAADSEPASAEQRDEPASAWQKLDLTLELRLPVAIVTATLGNVAEALDFIPGTHLLPHVTKVLRTKLGDRIFQAVAYGELLVLPATLEINGKRGLPVPRAIYYDKMGGGFDNKDGRKTVYNILTEKHLIEKGGQKKGYRSGYVEALKSVAAGADKLPAYKSTPKTLLMHNTVEDRVQRPTEEVGGVYSREAISAGTTLRSEIRLTKKLADELTQKLGADWWQSLSGCVRLGASRKDDYGLAKLRLSAPEDFDSSPPLNGNRLTVCFVSDCLLRNSHLRQTNLTAELARELSDKLGVTLKPVKSTAQETTALLLTRRIESWHEGWGLPRPTLIAIEAGSCVVFEAEGNLTVEKLRDIEAAGIGERRGEGYGQVRFNPPLLTEKINGWAAAQEPESGGPPKSADSESPTDEATSELTAEERKFAHLIEEAAWREELKVAVLKVADSSAERERIFGFDIKEEKPPMSQVGGLRSAINRLRSRADAPIVLDWLEHLKNTKNRREKWASDEGAAKAKIARISELIAQENEVWTLLRAARAGETKAWQAPPPIVRSVKELQEIFWAEAVRALFDACARAHKRELERKGDN